MREGEYLASGWVSERNGAVAVARERRLCPHARDEIREVVPADAVGVEPQRFVTLPRLLRVYEAGELVAMLCGDCVADAWEPGYGLKELV